MATKRITVDVSQELYGELAETAERLGTSIQNIVISALAGFFLRDDAREVTSAIVAVLEWAAEGKE